MFFLTVMSGRQKIYLLQPCIAAGACTAQKIEYMKRVSLIVVLSLVFFETFSQSGDRLAFLLEKLHDGGASGYVMIFAHRGDWRNAPENSLLAYQNCIDAGFDGIEIDVQLTKDNEVVIMHDKTLDRTTNGSGKVADKTLDEIQALRLRNGLGRVTEHRPPSFREVLRLAKGKILLHVDKWPAAKDRIIEVAEEEGCLNQLIFRSSWPSARVHETLGDVLNKATYIPVLVCNGETDNERLDDFLGNIDSPVVGVTFKDENYEILDRVQEIKDHGRRVWYNSLWPDFNGGHDDDRAVYDPENSYGWLVEHGADIVMTDRPFLLDQYLKSIGKR